MQNNNDNLEKVINERIKESRNVRANSNLVQRSSTTQQAFLERNQPPVKSVEFNKNKCRSEEPLDQVDSEYTGIGEPNEDERISRAERLGINLKNIRKPKLIREQVVGINSNFNVETFTRLLRNQKQAGSFVKAEQKSRANPNKNEIKSIY